MPSAVRNQTRNACERTALNIHIALQIVYSKDGIGNVCSVLSVKILGKLILLLFYHCYFLILRFEGPDKRQDFSGGREKKAEGNLITT